MAVLEKIKLRDFKSFRSATIPLCDGYTCIIGPNGSGKSNILDALAFVLGTGSMKNLRASRLTDLVNHHSKSGTASVAIELRDGKEKHTIAREIDKKGNSIFKLNGKRTTKHRIEDLLYSLNIQPDGHNLILQGEITRIIRMTPLQRRKIIDEISGIAEYDQKKEEALRELEKVEAKVREANIIIGEKKERVKELQAEKEAAEKYSYLQSQKRNYLASLVKKELDEIDKVYQKAIKKIESRQAALAKYSEERLEAEKRIEEVKNQIKETETEIFEESSRKQKEAAGKVENLKQELGKLESELGMLRELHSRLSSELEKEREKLVLYSTKASELEKEIENKTFREDDLEREIAVLQDELKALNIDETNSRIEKNFEEIRELESNIERVRTEANQLEKKLGALQERINLKKAALSEEIQTGLDNKKEEIEKQVKQATQALEKKERELLQVNSKLKNLGEKEKEKNRDLQELEKQLKDLRKQAAGLERKTVHSAGLASTSSKIISAKLPGVLGTIAGLCDYDKKYEKAVETAAGARLFYIVTRTADDAVKTIQFLKTNQLGRATFIPLDKVSDVPENKELKALLKNPACMGRVIDFVRHSPELKKAFRFVFGDTLLVKDLSGFKKIGIGKARMVTLEGDLAEQSGIISGGSHQEKASAKDIIQLERVREKISSLEEKREDMIQSLRSLREKMSRIREEKAAIEIGRKESEVLLRQAKERLSEIEKTAYKDKQRAEILEKEIVNMEQEIQKKEKDLEKANHELEELLAKKAALLSEIDSLTSNETQKKAAEIKDKIKALEAELQEIRVSKGGDKARLNDAVKKDYNNTKKRISQLEKELKELEEKQKTKEQERNSLLIKVKDAEEKVRELAGSMTALFSKKSELEKEYESLEESLKKLGKKGDKAKEELKEAEIEKARNETRRRDLEREWERLKDANLIKASEQELRKGLETVEAQIMEIGSVNMKAIELYEAEKEKVKEFSEKKKKLEDEKISIINLMQEIESKKVSTFMQTFNALSTFFGQYFAEFYPETGAKAGLKLDNPEKPLESGLVIEASPKGTKLKNLDALSGGEKTITALAFIFAIQAYNPSPFYVLDEVEAALDAPNSERVANMFKKFSKKTQLIIITHNSSVVKQADQVIGVHLKKDKSSFVEVNLKALAEAQMK